MQKRFTEATREYVLAARNQVGNRERKECPTIEEYVALRRDTSAIKVGALCMFLSAPTSDCLLSGDICLHRIHVAD